MRKILFLLAMLPMFMFSACSDDDDKIDDSPKEQFIEPLMCFGETKSYVKSKETRILSEETSTMLKYKGDGLVAYVLYVFNSDGEVFGSSMQVLQTNKDEFADFLSNKYKIVSQSGNTMTLASKDGKITVILRVNGKYLESVYAVTEDL